MSKMSELDADNFAYLSDDVTEVPFVPVYTCPKCHLKTIDPIAVKKSRCVCLYCPYCHAYLMNANKRQRDSLYPANYRKR